MGVLKLKPRIPVIYAQPLIILEINLKEEEPPASVGRRRWRRHRFSGDSGCLKILPEKHEWIISHFGQNLTPTSIIEK